jgi:hypothetical protein
VSLKASDASMYRTAGIAALVALTGGAEAFAPQAAGPALRARAAPAVCSLSATANSGLSRRSLLSSAFVAATGLSAP